MSRYELDKYDTLSDIKFHCRQVLRAFMCYREHTDTFMKNLAKVQCADNKDCSFILSEKLKISERSIEKIDIGVQEIDILFQLDAFCNILDAERVRTRLQVQRLIQENKWLRVELHDLQRRLIKLEENVVSAEAEKQHFQFVYKMRNLQRYDEPQSTYLINAEDEEDTDPEEEIPTKIKAVHNLCMDYIREKRYEVAIPLCEEHVQQIKTKQGDGNNDVATLYSIMAKLHKEQGNLSDAQKLYEESLKIREKVLGKEHNAVGITLTNLAQILYKRNNLKDAEKHATQALKIREKTLGKNSAEVALIHAHLGLYAVGLGKWNDVINHYKVAMTVYDQMYDSTDSLIIRGNSNMAKAYVKLKQNDKAAEMLGVVCKSYQQKNSNTNDNALTVFQTAQQHSEGKITELSGDYLIKVFGSYESAIAKDVLETMIEYFTNIKKEATADALKAWIDSCDKQPNPVVRQSIMSRVSKRGSMILEKKMSALSQSSKKDKSSIMGFFKREKKSK